METIAPRDIFDRPRIVVWPTCDCGDCSAAAALCRRLDAYTLYFCDHHGHDVRIMTPLNTAGWESFRLVR